METKTRDQVESFAINEAIASVERQIRSGDSTTRGIVLAAISAYLASFTKT